jgi:hypothetical protein
MCNLKSSELKHQIKVEGKTTLIGTLSLTKKNPMTHNQFPKKYRFRNKGIILKRLKIVIDYIEEKVQSCSSSITIKMATTTTSTTMKSSSHVQSY